MQYVLDYLAEMLCGLSCVAAFIVIVGFTIFHLELIDTRAIRRLLRQRRFGIGGMLLLMAVVSVDVMLVRLLGVPFTSPMAGFLAIFLSLFAVAIVGFVVLLFNDIRGGRVGIHRKLNRHVDTLDPFEEVEPDTTSHAPVIRREPSDEQADLATDGQRPDSELPDSESNDS